MAQKEKEVEQLSSSDNVLVRNEMVEQNKKLQLDVHNLVKVRSCRVPLQGTFVGTLDCTLTPADLQCNFSLFFRSLCIVVLLFFSPALRALWVQDLKNRCQKVIELELMLVSENHPVFHLVTNAFFPFKFHID